MKQDEHAVPQHAFKRRTFLKGSAAAALGAGLGSNLFGGGFALAEEKQAGSQDVVTPGACRGGCGGGCQMNVHVRDGKIVKTSRIIQSNPDTSRLCNKGLSHALRVYGEDRLRYPMKRAGERGEGKWEQISWDEAISTIADKWKEVEQKHGASANAFIKGSGNMTPDAQIGLRLQSAMGATLLDPAQDRALYVAGPASLGYSQRFCGSGLEDIFNTKNLIVWGYCPTESATAICHYVLRAKAEHGTNLIVIDPSYTVLASKADMHVPVHPGTDGALALAMANVLVGEGLVDEPFLKRSTVAPFLVKESDGTYLRLSDLGRASAETPEDVPVVRAADGTMGMAAEIPDPVINGTFTVDGASVTTAYDLFLERIGEWTPEKASEVCDVPVDKIKELAHIMVDGPSAVAAGIGIDHYTNGVATYAAIFGMTMLAGQFGKPGTGIKGAFAAESSNGFLHNNLYVAPDAPPTEKLYSPALLNCMDSGKYGDADLNVKTLYIWNHNLFGTQVGGVKWRKFFEEVELLVVADVVMNSTANYADIVLPACHYFECETAIGDQTKYVFYSAKAAEPLYESKSDFDIFQMLFERMGLEDKGFKDRDELFETVLDNPVAKEIGLTWDRLKKEGAVLTRDQKPYVYGADGTYGTPTKRLQFYQEKIPLDTDYGQKLDFMKERLPYWEPPIEGYSGNPLAEKYPLVFTSERSKFKVHTQYTKVPWFFELEDEPYVMVNPADCEERGIADHDYIRLFNDRGTCTLRARYNDGIRPGMAVIDHGWDQDQFVDGFYCDLIGYNVTPVVANSYYFDALIQMEKVDR